MRDPASSQPPPPERVGCLGFLWLLVKLPFMILRAVPHTGVLLRHEAATDSGRRAWAREELAPLDGRAAVAAVLAEVRSHDAGFDLTAFLDSARVAVGAYAMAWSAANDRLLRHITTPGYWHTPGGKAVAAVMAEWRHYAGTRPGTANRGRLLLVGAPASSRTRSESCSPAGSMV